jgi:hypothetical protein
MELRTCKVCGITKPISEYYKHAGYADTKCKECARAYSREYGRTHKEKVKAYRVEYYQKNKKRLNVDSKRWTEENRELHNKYCKKWNKEHYDERIEYQRKYRAENPDIHYAHGKISSKLQYGKLQKPCVCEVCGKEGRVEAHHADYSKPLDVIWCCKKCHWKLDEERRALATT